MGSLTWYRLMCVPTGESQVAATISLQDSFFSGTWFHLVHRLTSLLGEKGFHSSASFCQDGFADPQHVPHTLFRA